MEKYVNAWGSPSDKCFNLLGEKALTLSMVLYLCERFLDFSKDAINKIKEEIIRAEIFLSSLTKKIGLESVYIDQLYAFIGVTLTIANLDGVKAWDKPIFDFVVQEDSEKWVSKLPKQWQWQIKLSDLSALIKTSEGEIQHKQYDVFNKDWCTVVTYKLGPNTSFFKHKKTAKTKSEGKCNCEREILQFYGNNRNIFAEHMKYHKFAPSFENAEVPPVEGVHTVEVVPKNRIPAINMFIFVQKMTQRKIRRNSKMS